MNKKILSLILVCTMGFASLSAQELVVKKKDGSAQTVGGKLYFKQKGDTDKKAEKVNEAVEKNLTYMSYVLDKKQMAKYTTLINTTLANRGLK